MNSGVMNQGHVGRWLRIGLVVFVAALAGGAGAWEQPSQWPDIGSVGKWKDFDAQFYRIYQDAPAMDQSQFKMDQIKEYEKTRDYGGSMDGITLQDFMKRDAGEQNKRRKLAARQLKFVVDFKNRMMSLVQQTKQGTVSGWGGQISDPTTIGDCLGKLRTAVGLDPSNPYAWHVLGYFAGVVGDRDRAAAALTNAAAALDVIPAGELTELRAAVALDHAWLLRDLGQFDDATAQLKKAVGYGAKGIEPRLIQGLIAAQTGNTQVAIENASALRSVDVRAFPMNMSSAGFAPELTDVSAWQSRSSNFIQSWIQALTWLEEGNTSMAAAAFGNYSLNDQYPFAQRFWNDAGHIYEATGRRQLALKAWSMARITNPYIVYFVYKPYSVDLGYLTGKPGPVPFSLGFGEFFISGSRLAYGSSLIQSVTEVTDTYDKQDLATKALDQLEICRTSGIAPGQAQVLEAQAYYLMGDLDSALMEIEGALNYMNKMGDTAGSTAVLQGLAKPRADLSPVDVANFFSQSGTSGGRWIQPKDLDAKQADLRAAYASDPSDSTRHDLARFLIRNGNPTEGRELALKPLGGQDISADNIRELSGEDLALVLEADRKEGEDQLALSLVKALAGGAEDPWNDSVLWVYAGFTCLDAGDTKEAKIALQRALELDPGNQSLRIQLAIMGDVVKE